MTNSASATCLLVTTPRLVVTQNCPTNAGNVLTYTGSVSNSGNITLTNVVVRSDRSGSNVVFMATTLAPGARVNFTGSYGAPEDACSVASTVTATAADKCTGSNVVATATITCPLPTTSRIVVTQTCPLIQVSPGGTLIYSGTVSNAGNATLTNVVVTSDRTGATNVFSIATLAPRASAPFTGRYTVSTDCCVDTSTLTATGRGCDGTLVRDTATRTCPLLTAPAITVTKVCPAEMWKPLAPGDRLTYSGVVSNSGNIALTNVTIVSTAPTNGIRIFGPVTLAAGESANYTASFIIPMDFCGTDTVTARGVSICTQLPVTGSATTTCPVMTTPGITVRKNCPAQPTPHGGLFVFTGSVSNSGNVTLTNVFVVNDQPAPNTPIIGPITLAPGARTNFTASYTAPLDCCEITDTLTARGRDRCSGTLVAATATQVCPLLTTPRIAVVLRCPATVVPNGGLYEFTGWVTNLGDVALTNVYVVSSKPVTNTVVLGPIELAPGEWEFLSGSFIMAPGFGNVILTASGLSTCGARVAIASANCSGPIRSQGTNAFTPSAGVFSGLFFEASEVQNESSGFFTLNLTAKGAYTASLSSQGKKYSASGKFDSEGKATNTIARTHTNPLLVVWSMDVNEADTITGSVGDGHWAAALTGDRATYNPKHNPAPQAGKYTLIIPGTPGATDSPQGDGFGTANIDANGTVQFVGTLADGAKVTQKVSISKDGHWPVYASLHTGRGSLLGWLVFADRSDDDVSGRLSWIRPAIPAGKLFPAGFAVDSDTIGSRYVAPVGKTNLVLQITNGIVIMNGGDMPAVSTNGITLGLGSKVVSTGTNKLTMTFTLSSGLFKGTLVESGLTGKQSFSGVVFQKANYGSGFCLGTNQSAQVVLQAAP